MAGTSRCTGNTVMNERQSLHLHVVHMLVRGLNAQTVPWPKISTSQVVAATLIITITALPLLHRKSMNLVGRILFVINDNMIGYLFPSKKVLGLFETNKAQSVSLKNTKKFYYLNCQNDGIFKSCGQLLTWTKQHIKTYISLIRDAEWNGSSHGWANNAQI